MHPLRVLALLVASSLAFGAPAERAWAQALPPLPPPVGQPPQQQPPPQQGGGSQPAPSAPGPVSPAPGSISVGVDVAHTGFYPDDELVPPLVPRWTVQSSVSSVLAADGRVYVLVGGGIAALDQRDGHQLWATRLPDIASGTAYDQGILFVTTSDDLFALSADSGAVLWKQHLADSAGASPPVASGGVVYAYYGQGGGTALAFRASDGTRLWTKRTVDGAGVPALDGDRVYYGGACEDTEALNRSDGSRVWLHETDCSGGGSVTPALFGGRLYVPEQEYTASGRPDEPVLDAGNGNVIRRFMGTRPVFVDGLAVAPFANGPVVGVNAAQAVDSATGQQAWSLRVPLLRPVAVGHDIYGLSGTVTTGLRIASFDAEKGGLIWDQRLPDRIPDVGMGGLAVAPGLLLVWTGESLTAFESELKPAPGAIALEGEADKTSGSTLSLTGVLGRDLRAARPPVRIDVGGWPRGAFRRYEDVRPLRDGGFVTEIVPFRNLRMRASASGVTSAPATVYVYPRIRLGRAERRGNRIKQGVVVSSPRVRLAGRTLVMYLAPAAGNRLTRLGAGRLRARGRGRAGATINLRAPRHVGRNDRIFSCIPGQLRLGLGRPSSLLRACGKRVLHG